MKSYHNGNSFICDDFAVCLVFEQFKNQFDRDSNKYDKICERNKENIKKRYTTKSTSGKTGIPEPTKSTYNDNNNDSDNKKEKFKIVIDEEKAKTAILSRLDSKYGV